MSTPRRRAPVVSHTRSGEHWHCPGCRACLADVADADVTVCNQCGGVIVIQGNNPRHATPRDFARYGDRTRGFILCMSVAAVSKTHVTA